MAQQYRSNALEKGIQEMTDKTDEWYLRRGVELADGWSDRDFDDGVIFGELSDEWYLQDFGWPQSMLDAIAAQLVRQLLAAGYDISTETQGAHFEAPGIWITIHDPVKSERHRYEYDARDHEEHDAIIKAIVDFAEASPGCWGE